MLDRAETADAQGRIALGPPVAVVDIGSNSVRLVAYEGLSRSPTPIYNEKTLCGLGRGVSTTGRLPQEGVDKALAALRRFRALCDTLRVAEVQVIATAAARQATNGPEFLAAAEAAIGAPITLLSGRREAELSALGVVAGIHSPDGVVGDLGGGSLEIVEVKGRKVGAGKSLPLGGLSLMDLSGKSPKKAQALVRDALKSSKPLQKLAGRTFYAVGGTWRALARLHMSQRYYPLRVMHNYAIPARDAMDFVRLVEAVDAEALISIADVSAARRPLLAYGAAALEEIIRVAKPAQIVISALGVREGLLYERLDAAERALDPLIVSASELNVLRSRAPAHGEELFAWTGEFLASTHFSESPDEARLRHAACLLSDIGWRAHPDYRGEQSLNIIANAAFVGIDHPGRAFLALATAYRHTGIDRDPSPQVRGLVGSRMLDRARVLGAAFRVAYVVSAAMPGVLPVTPLVCRKDRAILTRPKRLAALGNDRLFGRLRQLARLIGREPEIAVEGN
ncbi:MAG: exopolyphosphatase [Hyphomicrobiales bacterium]|nr:exopolyphosphatase [Hyphomicrobiales bacterium]